MSSSKYTLPRGYLSPSAIGMLQRCPKQYEFRYVEGLVLAPNIALLTGSAVHRGFEHYYKDRMEKPDAPRLAGKQVAELSVSEMEALADEAYVKLEGKQKDDAIGELITVTESYIDYVAGDIVPLSIEREVRYRTPNGVEVLGFLDLTREPTKFEQVFLDTEEITADYKITGKKWSHSNLVNSLQFNLYALATGIGATEIHNITKGCKKPLKAAPVTDAYKLDTVDVSNNIRIIRHKFDGSSAPFLDMLVETCAQLITNGVFAPCAPDSWCCSPTWCGYYSRCRGIGAADADAPVFVKELPKSLKEEAE